METNKPNNPSIYPKNGYVLSRENESYYEPQDNLGLTLRDYFANSALQGIINSFSPSDSCKYGNHIWAAEMAYKYADAMLKKREQDGK